MLKACAVLAVALTLAAVPVTCSGSAFGFVLVALATLLAVTMTESKK